MELFNYAFLHKALQLLTNAFWLCHMMIMLSRMTAMKIKEKGISGDYLKSS